MNLRFRDPDAFAREYQNTPMTEAEDADLLSIDQIQAKLSAYERGIVPPEANTLTAFVDVQGEILYYCVIAWRSSDFSGGTSITVAGLIRKSPTSLSHRFANHCRSSTQNGPRGPDSGRRCEISPIRSWSAPG